MSKLRNNTEKKEIILIIFMLVILIISLILYYKLVLSDKENTGIINNTNIITKSEQKQQNEQIQIPKTNEELINHLSTLGERDRMEYYCGVYFKHIEKKEYESAYNLLYSEFKQNYFPTLEEYVEYIEKTYPKYWALNYDDITRQGNIYVIRLEVLDVLGSKEDERVQRIVLRENNYNNFEMSFQVI